MADYQLMSMSKFDSTIIFIIVTPVPHVGPNAHPDVVG